MNQIYWRIRLEIVTGNLARKSKEHVNIQEIVELEKELRKVVGVLVKIDDELRKLDSGR